VLYKEPYQLADQL